MQWVCKKEDLAAMCGEDQTTFVENLKQFLVSELQVSFDLGIVKVEERDHDLRNIITNFQFIENEEDNTGTLHESSLIASNKDSTKKSVGTS